MIRVRGCALIGFTTGGSLVGEPRAQHHLEGVMDDDNVGTASGVSKSNEFFLKKKKLLVLVLVTGVLVRLENIGSAGCYRLGFTQAACVWLSVGFD